MYEGNAKVKVATGYTVKLVSVESYWHVNATPLAHSTTWAGQPQTATIAYSGSDGDAQVALGSYALLVDGEACYSAGPIDVW